MSFKEQKSIKKRKTYRVDVRMPDGRRVTKSFRRKYDADQFKAELFIEKEQVKDTGIYIKNDITFKEYAEIWLKTEVFGRKAKKTEDRYKSDLTNYILPLMGKIQLKHINYHHARLLENYVLKAGRSPATVNKVMNEFKAMLNDGIKLDYLLKNPIRGYPELKSEPTNLEFWSKEDIKIFIEANKNDPLLDFYIVALNTGLRLGEICGLCWDRVDFNSSTLNINRSISREGLRNTTKTHTGRYVPMNTTVKAILLKRFKSKISKYVFCDVSGEALPYNHITQRFFKKAQKKAALSKIIRFHDLRHTFASHFMMNGGNIYTLQKLLGHTDIKTTMIYAHLDNQFLKEATEIINFG